MISSSILKNQKHPKNPEGCPYICESCSGHISDTVIGVIDVTKKCDLRCAVCFSTFSDHIVDYEPTKDELVNMLNVPEPAES